MRTTLDIDDDVLAAAKDLAKAEGRTTGQIISELARRALTTPSAPGFGEPESTGLAGHWPIFPGRAGLVVTTTTVERIQDELDREDASIADQANR